MQPHGLGRHVVKLLSVELRRPRLVFLLRIIRHAMMLPEEEEVRMNKISWRMAEHPISKSTQPNVQTTCLTL